MCIRDRVLTVRDNGRGFEPGKVRPVSYTHLAADLPAFDDPERHDGSGGPAARNLCPDRPPAAGLLRDAILPGARCV